MLYLIQSYTKDGPILKVGYASNIDNRMSAYKTHNPGYELLGIREGDEELENAFHRYFFLYTYKNYSEWFIYEPELIRVFKKEPDEYFSDSIRLKSMSSQKDVMELSCMRLIEKYPHLSEFFKKFYLELTLAKERMRYLCKFLEDNPIFESEILVNVPQDYRRYYVSLGPKRCYAFSYQMSRLEEEYQKQLNNQTISSISLKDLIYNSFKEGEKYSKADLKLIVQKIYDHLGLKKTGKASDFEEWFEMKECKIVGSDKKRQAGFELIKKREKD